MGLIKYKWEFNNLYNNKVLKNVEIKVNNEKINIKNNKKLNIKNNIEKIIWVNAYPKDDLIIDKTDLNCNLLTKISNDGFKIDLYNDVPDFRIATKNLYQFDESENIYNINLCLNFTNLNKNLAPTFYLVYPKNLIDDKYFVYCDNISDFYNQNLRCNELDLFEFNLNTKDGDVLMQITLHSDKTPCNDIDFNSGCRYYVVFTDKEKENYNNCKFDISGWNRNKNNNCNTVFLKKGNLFDGNFGLNIQFNNSNQSIEYTFFKNSEQWNDPIIFKDGGNESKGNFNIKESIKNIFSEKFCLIMGINSATPPFGGNENERMCCYLNDSQTNKLNEIENYDSELYWSISNLKLENIKVTKYIHYQKVKYNQGKKFNNINICNLN